MQEILTQFLHLDIAAQIRHYPLLKYLLYPQIQYALLGEVDRFESQLGSSQ